MRTTPLPGGIDPDLIATRQEFALALTAVREAAGLTVREVARNAGLSSSTVGGYFSGRHLPPLRPDGGIRTVLAACGITASVEIDTWQRAIARIRRAPGPRPEALPAPYRGLEIYRPADAGCFHGRDGEAALLLDRVARGHPVRERPDRGFLRRDFLDNLFAPRPAAGRSAIDDADEDFVVLLGRAGSGKTSLVNAGLLPALHATHRPVVILTPTAHPLRELAAAVARLGGTDPDTAHAALLESPAAVRGLLTVSAAPEHRVIVLPDVAEGAEPDRRPVLVIDQFELLIATGADTAEQDAFVRALATAAHAGARTPAPATVLVVLRTEAVPGVARFPDLAAALRTPDDARSGRARTVHLTSMDDDALRAAILGPARRAGLDVDPELVDAVLADVAELERQGAAVLPRLSHALLATWRRDRRGRLTLAAYREAGGVLGSVETAAEAVCRSLPDTARAGLANLFRGRGEPDAVPTVPADATDVVALRAFVEAGLLAESGGRLAPPSVGLVQGWPRARGSLDLTGPASGTDPRPGDPRPGRRPYACRLGPRPHGHQPRLKAVSWCRDRWVSLTGAAFALTLLMATGIMLHGGR